MMRSTRSLRRAPRPGWLLALALTAGCDGGVPEAPPAAGGSGASVSAGSRPMSVLLLSFDTLRRDRLGFYGCDLPVSPHLDALLAEAFVFDRAVTPVPRTTPAFASLLTGAYPHTHGVRRLHDSLGEGAVTLAQTLRRQGYQTLAVITNRVLGRERKLQRGFEVYDQDIDLRIAPRQTAAALRRLDGLDPGRPVFAWIHYIDPHMPYQPPPELAAGFDPDYEGRYALHFGAWKGSSMSKERFSRQNPFPKELQLPEAAHANPLPDEVNAHVRRLYAADVRAADEEVAAVVEKMRSVTGGNLLVVFTSDHGESLGEHGYFWSHGDYVYNATTRVPLAFLLPEGHPLRGAARNTDWVSLVDVAPTILELAGADPADMSAQMEGRSLVPAITGRGWEPQPVFSECGRAHFFRFVRGRVKNTVEGRFRAAWFGDWKLIWTPLQEDPGLAWQLYEVAEDPDEKHDVWRPDHPRFAPLRDALLDWTARGHGRPEDASGLGADEARLLNELGYVAEEDAGS